MTSSTAASSQFGASVDGPAQIHGPSSRGKARYIMIGGFLGAGKTTAVAKLAERLTFQGKRVGLITNDQGSELVDTKLLRARGFQTEEISGGCFCCRFRSLVEAADKLSSAHSPDVFIAEPVGSCTDLIATVSYPLRRIYGSNFSVAPLSVLVDPLRALRVLGNGPGANFSEKVAYIYRKQLEEADIIVINKCDAVAEPQLKELRGLLSAGFPERKIFQIAARSGAGLEPWFNELEAEPASGSRALQIDYDLYAEGEALLGWLNCTVQISSPEELDGNDLLRQFASLLHGLLREQGAEIAHLKMTLNPDSVLGDLGVINLVRNDFRPELSQELSDSFTSGQLVLNLRAEAPPESLSKAVSHVLALIQRDFPACSLTVEHQEFFRPGRPEPTHRFSSP